MALRIEEKKPLVVNRDSLTVQGLLKMLEHKRLREQFWFGEMTFAELNK